MTEAEKERIRQEMMSDAQNREIERSIRVQEYDDREKNASKTIGSGNFIQPLLSSAVDKHSLEEAVQVPLVNWAPRPGDSPECKQSID